MDDYKLPKKLPSYLQQILTANSGHDENQVSEICEIISKGRFVLREGASTNHWNGDSTYDHDLVFYVPLEVWTALGLGAQGTRTGIANLITCEINQLNELIENESIEKTIIAQSDDNDEEYNASKPLQRLIEPQSQPFRNIEKFDKTKASVNTPESSWDPSKLRVFISHRDSSKREVKKLADLLTEYGVGCFVAHEDIEPTKAWQSEILGALQSMEVMIAYITDDFFDSPWTNQEVGFALAKGIRIVSLKMAVLDPQGLISSEQALSGHGLDPAHLADEVISCLLKNSEKIDTSTIRRAFIDAFVASGSFRHAEANFADLQKTSNYTEDEIDELVSAFNDNGQILNAAGLSTENAFLCFVNSESNRQFEKVEPDERYSRIREVDEIPF